MRQGISRGGGASAARQPGRRSDGNSERTGATDGFAGGILDGGKALDQADRNALWWSVEPASAACRAMHFNAPESIAITVSDVQTVSGLLQVPKDPRACYVLAHGAGAGMTHPFMAAVADDLAQRGIATLRYQFPFMEKGGRRPDAPKLAQATVRAATMEAVRRLPDLPLFAGGKSFGGRMTSQAQALAPLPRVHGLIFLGFPLHPAAKPSNERAKHLFDVRMPMLFLQGTRDKLADLDVLQPLCAELGAGVSLQLVQDADHMFHVPARSGRKDADVRIEMMDAIVSWVREVVARGG